MRNILLLILTTSLFSIQPLYVQPNDKLLCCYTFINETEDTIAHDQIENQRHLTLIGNVTFAPDAGKIGGTLNFYNSENGGSAEDEDRHLYINGLDAFTASLWVKSDTISHDRGIFHGKEPDGGDTTFTLRYDVFEWHKLTAANIITAAITTTHDRYGYESSIKVQTTDWQHLTLTWQSGEKLKLYNNRVLDTPVYVDIPINNAPNKDTITGATKFVIGRGEKDYRDTSWVGLISVDEIMELASGEEEEEIST